MLWPWNRSIVSSADRRQGPIPEPCLDRREQAHATRADAREWQQPSAEPITPEHRLDIGMWLVSFHAGTCTDRLKAPTIP
jgi:hypothetical protein